MRVSSPAQVESRDRPARRVRGDRLQPSVRARPQSVGVGILPRFRAYLPIRKPRVYGLVGGVFYVHPYTLHGVQAGLGLNIDLHRSFALFGELSAAGFFAGSDLMEGSGLGKLDGVAGIRITF